MKPARLTVLERKLLHALQYYMWQNEPEVIRMRWIVQSGIRKAKKERAKNELADRHQG